MDADRGPKRLLEEDVRPAPQQTLTGRLFDSSDTAIAIRVPEREKKPLDKRTLDYIIKTGVAGGLAGCAVGGLEE